MKLLKKNVSLSALSLRRDGGANRAQGRIRHYLLRQARDIFLQRSAVIQYALLGVCCVVSIAVGAYFLLGSHGSNKLMEQISEPELSVDTIDKLELLIEERQALREHVPSIPRSLFPE